MQTRAVKMGEIRKELSILSDDKLDEVKDFIEFVIARHGAKNRNAVKLQGIWAGKGFEDIVDIDEEIKKNRMAVMDAVLQKKVQGIGGSC